MKNPIIVSFFLLNLLISCNNPSQKTQNGKAQIHTDTLQQKISESISPEKDLLMAVPEDIKPVLGYRFIISGDFDGDGKREKLTEHYFSALDNKETNKFYEGLSNYDQLVNLTDEKKPYSFVSSNNKHIDTLHISSETQLLGLSYLKNEGDLNGDGTDEVSYVINWADWSNFNTWHIVTYKHGKWKELYAFSIRDWQIPDLPQTYNQQGVFGLENKIINTTNDSVNKLIEKELLSFKGLVKKIKTNKIRVIYINDESFEDTVIVDLKRLK